RHHEPIQRRAAGAYAGQREKSIGSGNAHAHMTVAVGDAFTIENVTAVDQFCLSSLSSMESKAGTLGLSMEFPFGMHLFSWFYWPTIQVSSRSDSTSGGSDGPIPTRSREWMDRGSLVTLLIICSPALVVRLRFKEALTSTCPSRRIPTAH